MVPELILAQKGCPGIYGHRNGARAHLCTGMVPGHKWALEGYLVTYGHRKGGWARLGTGKVPRCIWAEEESPGIVC